MKIDFWNQEFKANMYVGCIGGFLISIAGTTFGFGGGPFTVPLMTVIMRLPMFLVVGSSLLAIFFGSTVGALNHLQHGNFDFRLFLIMAPAAILGGQIGPEIAKRLNPVIVKRIACVGLLILGCNLLGLY